LDDGRLALQLLAAAAERNAGLPPSAASLVRRVVPVRPLRLNLSPALV